MLNPTNVVKMLLAFGANPHAIPGDMWLECLEDSSPTPSKGMAIDSLELVKRYTSCQQEKSVN